MNLADNELLAKIKEKDAAALVTLIHRYIPRVYNWVRASVPESDIEDIVQEVFIAVATSIYTFKGSSSFYTYIFKITKFKITDYYRKSGKEKKEFLTADIENQAHTEPAQQKMAGEDISTLLSCLSAIEYQVVIMRFLDGCSFKEISENTGLSYEAVRSKFRRALEKAYKHKKKTDLKV